MCNTLGKHFNTLLNVTEKKSKEKFIMFMNSKIHSKDVISKEHQTTGENTALEA